VFIVGILAVAFAGVVSVMFCAVHEIRQQLRQQKLEQQVKRRLELAQMEREIANLEFIALSKATGIACESGAESRRIAQHEHVSAEREKSLSFNISNGQTG